MTSRTTGGFRALLSCIAQVYDHAAAAVKEVFPEAEFGLFNRSMPQRAPGVFEHLSDRRVFYIEVVRGLIVLKKTPCEGVLPHWRGPIKAATG